MKHKLAGTPVQGLVTAVVKGGLLVDVGVRGFMPASQVDSGWVEDLSTFVGTKISARVIDLDPSRRSVVLSRRELVDRRRQQRASELRDELAPGDEVESVVLKKIDRSFVVRVDDALEVWIPEDQVTREVEHLSIGDRIPVTVCDISDTRVIGSFRLESSIERNAEPSTDEVNSIASESGGLLKVVDGLLTVEVSIDHALPEHLSQAVEMATRGGVAVLFVASEPGVKREVRRLVQSGQVPGVDARRSRQASDGLWLTLNPKI